MMEGYVPGTPVQAPAYGAQSIDGQQRSRSAQRPSITTNMISLWDANQTGLKLNVSALDNGISLAIWVPHIGTDGRKTYPKEQRYSVFLSQKNCIVLEDLLVNHLLVDYNSSKNGRYSIFTNAVRSNLIEFEVLDGEFYANLYSGCDATTGIAQSTARFKFESAVFNDSYDPTTGVVSTVPVQADMYMFVMMVRGFNRLCTGLISGHGTRMATSYDSSRLMNYIHAIANSVHAQLPAPSFQNTPQVQVQTPQMMVQAQAAPTPALTEVNSLSDLVG